MLLQWKQGEMGEERVTFAASLRPCSHFVQTNALDLVRAAKVLPEELNYHQG